MGWSSMYTPDAPLRGGLAVVDAKGPFRPLFHGEFAVGRPLLSLDLTDRRSGSSILARAVKMDDPLISHRLADEEEPC